MNQANAPFLDDAFHIKWSTLTADCVEADITRAIELTNTRIAAVYQEERELGFESTMMSLESANEPLKESWAKVNHLDKVCNSTELREAYNKMLPEVTELHASIFLNDELWSTIKAYSKTDEAAGLAGVRKRYLDETMREFRLNGADLPEDEKAEFKELEKELARKTQEFAENVLDSTNAWELIIDEEAGLAGLPQLAREAARQSALEKGLGTEQSPKWRFTLQMPSYFPLMKYLDDQQIRKQAWEAAANIAAKDEHDNSQLVWDILGLRQDKAEMLGRSDFADLVLEDRMAKTGATALSFVDEFHQRIKTQFDREVSELESFKAEKTAGPVGPLEPWEVMYWSEKRREELFDFDDEQLRPYFPIDGVMAGMFQIAEKLFGITIKRRETLFFEEANPADHEHPQVWHPEAKFYDINDGAHGEHLGSFYADWHPRESKRGGAWMNHFKTGVPPTEDKERQPHLGLICGNLTPSVGDGPALLTHREVQTIFHEFGHLLHHLLGEVEIKSFNGVNVPWDFVELPSQLMENFCWDRQSLDLFARHHETGEPIPADLFQKMLDARSYMSAVATMGQLAAAKMDLELHINHATDAGDLEQLIDEILEGYRFPTNTKPLSIVRKFRHLFSHPTGYAAGYYSYKWAEVLDADAFARFQAAGVLNMDVGMEFREKILSRGNSDDPATLYKDFMGRDPSVDALLVRSGLA